MKVIATRETSKVNKVMHLYRKVHDTFNNEGKHFQKKMVVGRKKSTYQQIRSETGTIPKGPL